MSTRLRRNRLIALFAVLTMIVGLYAYSAHGFGDRVHENGHCDLCVHFSGTAGAPVQAAPIGKPVLVARAPVERRAITPSARRRVVSCLPRGPPDPSALI